MIDKIESTFDLEQIRKIEDYCNKAQIQVLHLMIVQMIGFSRENEDKLKISVQELFENLVTSKTETYNGLRLKQRNRSILLAFSDPTSAVKAALDLQIDAVDIVGNHGVKLQVKIGIHAGQTLVNDKFNQLIFNNQINFTSNLESMAEIGHIYLTSHVYTGAGTWLDQQSPYNIVHKKHGSYFLGDVKEHTDIYEVSNKKIQHLKPPDPSSKKKKKSNKRTIVFAIALFVIIIFTIGKCKKTSVYLQDFSQEEIFLNQTHKQLFIAEYDVDELRKIDKQFKKGKHKIYYDSNPSTRYYATLNVKKGTNKITPRFRKQRLPKLQKSIILNRENGYEDAGLGNKRWSYSIYNKNNIMISHDAEISMSIRGEINADNKYEYKLRWRFDMDGGNVNSGEEVFTEDTCTTISFHKDKLHYIDFEINIEDNEANITLISVFADYKK
jgi:class 3 adenylate cyclase